MPALILHASDPLWRPANLESLTGTLHDLGLLGMRTSSEVSAEFVAGEQFLKLLMFLGCSPQVVLDPDTAQPGQSVCYIRLLVYQTAIFIAAAARPAARCSNCRAAVDLPSVVTYAADCRCQNCGKRHRLADLDWRQAAGFARCFVEIYGIYPQEAVPSNKLLNGLRAYSHCDWKHFYV